MKILTVSIHDKFDKPFEKIPGLSISYLKDISLVKTIDISQYDLLLLQTVSHYEETKGIKIKKIVSECTLPPNPNYFKNIIVKDPLVEAIMFASPEQVIRNCLPPHSFTATHGA